MAVQINLEELKGCKSYFGWIRGKIEGAECSEELCRILFETDFTYELEEDDIRARDAMVLRERYAEETGEEEKKDSRETDRIWKSIHGKCSILELLLSLCIRLDEMVNEEEKGAMVPDFFRILIENLELDSRDDEDYDHRPKAVEDFWKAKINRFLGRKYMPDGSGGGLFPLKKWDEKSGKDQRKVSVWYQMNSWLDENLDEDGYFQMEKFAKKER